MLEIEIVVTRLGRGLIRQTVGELERTEAGFRLIWRRDGRWSFGGHFHLRSVGPMRRRECHSAAKSGSREEVLREDDRFHYRATMLARAFCVGIGER